MIWLMSCLNKGESNEVFELLIASCIICQKSDIFKESIVFKVLVTMNSKNEIFIET